VRAKLSALANVAPTRPRDRRAIERRLREKLTDWRVMLAADTANARLILDQLLVGRLVFTPAEDTGKPCYRMTGTFALGRTCSELLRSHGMASPGGLEPPAPRLGGECSIH
jgi:hypothetical protein